MKIFGILLKSKMEDLDPGRYVVAIDVGKFKVVNA